MTSHLTRRDALKPGAAAALVPVAGEAARPALPAGSHHLIGFLIVTRDGGRVHENARRVTLDVAEDGGWACRVLGIGDGGIDDDRLLAALAGGPGSRELAALAALLTPEPAR